MRSLLTRNSPHRQPSSLVLQILAFAAVYLIWGSTYLAIHYAIKSYPPFIMLGVRFGLAGLLMYGVLRLRGHEKPTGTHVRSATIMGILLLFVGTGSIAWAETFIPTGLAALLVATVPLWIVLLEWLWLKGPRPSPRIILALAIGITGVSIVVQPPSQMSGDVAYIAAIAISILAAFSWSFGSLLGRRMELPRSPFMGASLQMIAGGMVLTVFGLLTGEGSRVSLSSITLSSSAAVFYLFFCGSLVAFSAYVWLMNHVSPSKLSTHAFVNPIVAVLLGTFVAGEALTLRIGIAGIFLVTAVTLIVLTGKRVAASQPTRLQMQIKKRRAEVLMAASLSEQHPPLARTRYQIPQPGQQNTDIRE